MPGVVNHLHGLILDQAVATGQSVSVLADDSLQLPNLHDHYKYSHGEFAPQFSKTVRRLAMKGATKILIPSMIAQTRHKVFRRSLPGTSQLVNLVDVAVGALARFPASTTFGVMCHQSVWESGLFQAEFTRRELKLVDASLDRDMILMHTSHAVDAVYHKRLDAARASIREAARLLKKRGAEVILLGSAALPLAWPIDGLDVELVNPLLEAARVLVGDAPPAAKVSDTSSLVSL